MDNETLINVSIAQLRRFGGIADGDDDDFLIVSRIGQPELFHYPCRLDAVVLGTCYKGSVTVEINLVRYTVTQGSSVISLPGNVIQLLQASEDFEGHVIVFSLDFLHSVQIDLKNVLPVYMYIRSHPVVEFPARAKEELNRFIELLQQCADDQHSKRRREIIKGVVSALMYKVCDELDRLTLPSEEVAGNRREALFIQFLDLLTEYHCKQRSVGFYASRLHITPKYMSALIKEVSGRSAAQWIDDYVILEAKSLLKYSDLSIQEIAYRLNFSTQSFFGKYFKQHTGISPGQYKAQ